MRLLGLSAVCILGAVCLTAMGLPEAAVPLLVGGLGFAIGVGLRWVFARLRGGPGAAPPG